MNTAVFVKRIEELEKQNEALSADIGYLSNIIFRTSLMLELAVIDKKKLKAAEVEKALALLDEAWQSDALMRALGLGTE